MVHSLIIQHLSDVTIEAFCAEPPLLINGTPCRHASLEPGDSIGIGPFRFTLRVETAHSPETRQHRRRGPRASSEEEESDSDVAGLSIVALSTSWSRTCGWWRTSIRADAADWPGCSRLRGPSPIRSRLWRHPRCCVWPTTVRIRRLLMMMSSATPREAHGLIESGVEVGSPGSRSGVAKRQEVVGDGASSPDRVAWRHGAAGSPCAGVDRST